MSTYETLSIVINVLTTIVAIVIAYINYKKK